LALKVQCTKIGDNNKVPEKSTRTSTLLVFIAVHYCILGCMLSLLLALSASSFASPERQDSQCGLAVSSTCTSANERKTGRAGLSTTVVAALGSSFGSGHDVASDGSGEDDDAAGVACRCFFTEVSSMQPLS
jgi:hypothetical protein